MKAAMLLAMLMALTAVDAFSQRDGGRQVQAYVFAGAGGITPGNVYTYWSGSTLTGGLGAEYVTSRGIGLSAEFEAIRRKTYWNLSTTSGLPSIDVSYHFRRGPGRKVEPFVSGGLTLFSGERTQAGGLNAGGGFQYWMTDRFAMRAEARNHTLLGSDTPINAYEFRIGVAFRVWQ